MRVSSETVFLFTVLAIGEALGRGLDFYIIVNEYDIIMHFVGGALVSSAIINFLVERLHHYSYITNVAVTLGVGAAWEVLEFLLDKAFGFVLQPSLADTMIDLIVVLGAALIINAMYWYRHVKLGLPVRTV